MKNIKLIIILLFLPLLSIAEDAVVVKEALATSASAMKYIWNYKLFSFDNHYVTISSLFIGLIAFIIGIRVARYCGSQFKRKLFAFVHLDKSSTHLISRVIDYILITIVVLIVLDIARVPLTIFTFIGGAFVVSIGLSSQHLMNNFISGLALIIEGKVKVGDIIEYDGDIGRVNAIDTRVVELKTQSNIQIFIPHSKLMQETFEHWTHNNERVRLSSYFKIDQKDKDKNDINFENIIINATAQSKGVLSIPRPELLLAQMDHHILCYEVRFWINLADSDRRIVTSEVNKSVLNTLKVHNITLAKPFLNYN
jgi:potassium-dependent mechanosensitive channel